MSRLATPLVNQQQQKQQGYVRHNPLWLDSEGLVKARILALLISEQPLRGSFESIKLASVVAACRRYLIDI